ncbi:hypothetical protein NBRC116594_16030 [Shimia sp. NS0008-38b]
MDAANGGLVAILTDGAWFSEVRSDLRNDFVKVPAANQQSPSLTRESGHEAGGDKRVWLRSL